MLRVISRESPGPQTAPLGMQSPEPVNVFQTGQTPVKSSFTAALTAVSCRSIGHPLGRMAASYCHPATRRNWRSMGKELSLRCSIQWGSA